MLRNKQYNAKSLFLINIITGKKQQVKYSTCVKLYKHQLLTITVTRGSKVSE